MAATSWASCSATAAWRRCTAAATSGSGGDVAIKVLRADLARDPAFQGRFRREAQSAASLNHPSIVAVYDTGEDTRDGAVSPYIVMEYVEGRTLRDVLAGEGRLLPQRALEITAQVCAALEEAHRAGIVHRDIKPAQRHARRRPARSRSWTSASPGR